MSQSMSAELHVLFGAGQVGQPLAQLLLEAGKQVRIAKRSPGGAPPGTEVMQGDAADRFLGSQLKAVFVQGLCHDLCIHSRCVC